MEKFTKITFNGLPFQYWADAKVKIFYADPENKIPIYILRKPNSASWEILCDQLQNQPEKWKKQVIACAVEIGFAKLKLDYWENKSDKNKQIIDVESKSKCYAAAHKLIQLTQEVQHLFEIPLTEFRSIK